MVSYIFAMAVCNLCLGFALAAHLGRRYRLMAARAGQAGRGFAPAADRVARNRDLSAAATAAAAVAEFPADGPTGAASAGRCPELAAAAAAGAPEPPPCVTEQSVSALRSGLGQYEDQVARANDALRSYTGVADAAAIEACLHSLLEATDEYLQHRQEAQKNLDQAPQQPPKLQQIHAQVQVALGQQDEQIQNTADSIANAPGHADPEVRCLQMVDETSKLMDASHQLRDTLDAALVEVARDQQRLPLTPSATQIDPLTGLSDRAGAEARLCRWWHADPRHARPLSAIMIDIDRFAELNQRFGHKTGDLVLRAVGKLLSAERSADGTAARFAGQCFLLLLPETDIHSATNTAERIRQTIDMAHFQYRGDQLRLTVSCAVTAALGAETTETLLARADATLREAKRYGRNRTFLHEGKYPTPVVPPSFTLEEKEISL